VSQPLPDLPAKRTAAGSKLEPSELMEPLEDWLQELLNTPQVARLLAVRSFFCIGTLTSEEVENEMANAEGHVDIKDYIGSIDANHNSMGLMFGAHRNNNREASSFKAVENVLTNAFSLQNPMNNSSGNAYPVMNELGSSNMDFDRPGNNLSMNVQMGNATMYQGDCDSYITEEDR